MKQPAERKWRCMTCEAVYDEAAGLPEYGIAPGTRFEDLPQNWVCPVCGTPKDDFELIPDS